VIILQKIVDKLINFSATKDPSFVVGGHVDPYLYRWYLIPRNKFLNIYLHKFLRSDDDQRTGIQAPPFRAAFYLGLS
jgi:hypothetical protein